MALKFAFAGFRHGHILSLYDLVKKLEGVEVVAACEEDAETREQLTSAGSVDITHDNIQAMLDGVDCDVVAIGDYFVRRGSLVIEVLQRGKHAISDKPMCTSLEELDEIERLAGEKGLKLGCMLTMRDAAQMIGVRQRIGAGMIGEVHAITFGGQHPLMLGSRAQWYFEGGKHGGTITDIAVHVVDAFPWVTGLEFATVNAARCWTGLAAGTAMEDMAQLMVTMDNGCGLLGDVSYTMPDRSGYSLPQYWRTTFWGRDGILETSMTATSISVALAGDEALREEELPQGTDGGYLREFLRDIEGTVGAEERSTKTVLKAARTVLKIQEAADKGLREVEL
jgi:predicted dehydrogenase